MKYDSKGGSNAWPSDKYLNIWVCNLKWVSGYASFPGGDPAKDGIVMNYGVFKWNKTTVHEAGHWMGLRHIWGDTDCGDDLIDDTPKQSTGTYGCPSGIRSTCSNGVNGDMYMNYMDVTDAGCTNLFTEGQKVRMRTVFDPGGPRISLLSSHALLPPTNFEIPLPEEKPVTPTATLNMYPNPASTEITLDLSYDTRWIGNTVRVTSVQGAQLIQSQISSKIVTINVSSLKPGIYFISAKREDGAIIKHKLVKI
jgi:hypothetical protein